MSDLDVVNEYRPEIIRLMVLDKDYREIAEFYGVKPAAITRFARKNRFLIWKCRQVAGVMA